MYVTHADNAGVREGICRARGRNPKKTKPIAGGRPALARGRIRIEMKMSILDLNKHIEKSNLENLQEYRKTAIIFQQMIEEKILDIWNKNNKKIDMFLSNIPLCGEGSAVNSSTAIGYLMEEFLVQQLSKNHFSKPNEKANTSAFDFSFRNEKIHLVVNLKAQKVPGGNNDGVCAGGKLLTFYTQDKKPKLYLVLKSKYSIDTENSKVDFLGLESRYLESWITYGKVKADRRGWSEKFNPLSGRLQQPKFETGISDIPAPSIIQNFIEKDFQNSINK